jgi:hypothetical protein
LTAPDGFPIGAEAGGGEGAVVEDPVQEIEHPEQGRAGDSIEQPHQQKLDEKITIQTIHDFQMKKRQEKVYSERYFLVVN